MASRSGVRLVVVFAALLTGLAMPASASNSCPWMNEATASGLLSAEATATFTAAAPHQPATCLFVENGPGVKRTLTITVEKSADAKGRILQLLRGCHGSPSVMQAIGNEAEECEVMQPHNLRGELAVGSVRDQVFSIAISTTMKNDPVLRREELQNRVETAAEQIAGNLF